MSNVKMYYLKEGKMSEEHKKKLSDAMKAFYQTHKMSIEHKRRIGEGVKRAWAIRKRYWRERGWI